MAKHFRLSHDGMPASCEAVMKRGQYADYPVGRVCKTASGWSYRPVGGPTMPATTKRAAIKKLLIARKLWIRNRSALEGARRRRRRR
jgi:hypothetical protein